MNARQTHGLLAEFASAEALLDAARKVRGAGYDSGLEAYSPFPVPGMYEAVGRGHDRIAPIMLLGAIIGGVGTFVLEWYSAVIDYPINIGGRPTFSWQAFLPASIEMTVLGAAIFGVIAMLIGNGLPRLHHPLFESAEFNRASSDRFFLLLRSDAAGYDKQRARTILDGLAPLTISEISP